MHTIRRTENPESIKPGPSSPTCHLYHTNFLMRHPSLIPVNTNVLCFLSYTQNSPVHHNTVVWGGFFSIKLSIAGRRSGMKSRDRQATFILCDSRWCLKWLSCLSPSPALSHIFCSAFHYLSIKLSNSAVWFAACLSSPHLLHHFHFRFLC